MRIKASDTKRFLGALGAALLLLAFVALRVTSCTPEPVAPTVSPPTPTGAPPPAQSPPLISPPPPAPAPVAAGADCSGPHFQEAARGNAWSLRNLAWTPFGRPETGWETYAPLIGREIGSGCTPDTAGFATALAAWQGQQRLPVTGAMTPDVFARLKGVMQTRRPFVQLAARKVCPAPPAETSLDWGRAGEGYGGKQVQLRPAALAAWRRMAAAARAEVPAIAADPRNLQIFSAYRSPDYDAARCLRDGNCDGIARAATCSPHRTGLVMDIYVGQAPGFEPDSSADPNRLFMSQTAAYRWLVANADRFGFINYPFEPWHWEWTGEAP